MREETPAELEGRDWFAKQLGDGWQTAGDGIYLPVDETSGSLEPVDDEQSPHEDLVDEIAPARQTNAAADASPRPRRWLRR